MAETRGDYEGRMEGSKDCGHRQLGRISGAGGIPNSFAVPFTHFL